MTSASLRTVEELAQQLQAAIALGVEPSVPEMVGLQDAYLPGECTALISNPRSMSSAASHRDLHPVLHHYFMTHADESLVVSALMHPSVTEQTRNEELNANDGRRRRLLRQWSPDHMLAELARNEDVKVRCRVAATSYVSETLLSVLLGDPEVGVRAAVAASRVASRSMFEVLARDEAVMVHERLARNPACPIEVVLGIQPAVSDNDLMFRDDVPLKTRNAVLGRLGWLDDAAMHDVIEQDGRRGAAMATKWNLGHDVFDRIERLYRDLHNGDGEVMRRNIGKNPYLPVDVAERLASSWCSVTRSGLAQTETTPAHVLDRLAQDDDVDVVGWVARNNAVQGASRLQLLKDPRCEVRGQMAVNTSLTDDEMRQLAGGNPIECDGVVGWFLHMAWTPPDLLSAFAHHPRESYREQVARHPGTPTETRSMLANDPAAKVRAATQIPPYCLYPERS